MSHYATAGQGRSRPLTLMIPLLWGVEWMEKFMSGSRNRVVLLLLLDKADK